MANEQQGANQPQVDYTLQEVCDAMPLWQTVRDCLDGQAKIKSRGVTYLPMPNPTDTSEANKARYTAYQTRALFANMTSRTLAGMVGTAFLKEPVATLPEMLMPLYDNVDGGAVTLDQQAKKVLSDTLAIGRCGLLTDYPERKKDQEGNPIDFTREDQNAGKVRPTIQFYFAEDILNWRYDTVNSIRKLVLVVLKESYTAQDDGFKADVGDQWRELRLVDGQYTVQLWRKVNNNIEMFGSRFTPTKADGQPFDYIPFEFCGINNNDGGIDEVPLLDLANLNIAHYRNSADFEEMVFIVGQPTPVIAGLSVTWAKQVLGDPSKPNAPPKPIVLGSTTALLLPEGGTASYLQVTASTLAMEAMEHKETQAVALGAKLVNQATVQRTAKEAGMDDAADQSTLLSAAKNVNAAYKRALATAALFVGAPVTDDLGYEINTDFEILTLDATALAARVKMWSDGAICWTECRSILRRAGIATETDKKAKQEIEADQLANAAAMGALDPTNDPGKVDANGDPLPPGSGEDA